MKIEPIFTDKDAYEFKIDDVIILELGCDAISVLKIVLPSSGYVEEFYKIIRERLDIEKMINDLLSKRNKINKISIDSEVCRVDGKIIFQISELEKYKNKIWTKKEKI